MTAAPQSPLVTRVAEAIRQVPLNISSTRKSGQNGLRDVEEVAQAALDACRAQNLLDTLRELIAASDACTEAGGDGVAAMLRFGEADKASRALVAEMEGGMTEAPRPHVLYAFYNPHAIRTERILNGVRIRSENEKDERILEYIGKSQITGRYVFWNANAKEFETIAEDRLQFLSEVA